MGAFRFCLIITVHFVTYMIKAKYYDGNKRHPPPLPLETSFHSRTEFRSALWTLNTFTDTDDKAIGFNCI
jgi:hypothetical protein